MLTCNDMTRAKKKVRRQCFAPLGVAYRTKASHNVNINHILFQNDKKGNTNTDTRTQNTFRKFRKTEKNNVEIEVLNRI